MMPWSQWNRADKTLLFAAVLFFFGLCLKAAYPGSVFSQGFLFVIEAALVGGIADWFAVTALFRKPLGFPYHTAILPRRRAEFIEAAIKLVQREFFTRKRLILMMDSYDWKSLLLNFVQNEDIRRQAADFVYKRAVGFVRTVDFSSYTEELSASVRREIGSIPTKAVFPWLKAYLATDGRDKKLLAQGTLWLRGKAESEEARQLIHDELEKLVQKKVQGAGLLGMLFASFAKASNIVNVDELTEVIREEAVNFLNEAADGDSETAQRLLGIFYEKLADAENDEALLASLSSARERFVNQLRVEQAVETVFVLMQQHVRDALENSSSEVSRVLRDAIDEEMEKAWMLLEENERVGVLLDELVHDMVGRSALKAQEMSGVIVREVMEHLTDEQLNKIVYSKVEPDLLWIRMNGSIVGAMIGCVLFAVMTAVR